MKYLLVTMNPCALLDGSERVYDQVSIRSDPKDTRRITTWMDRVQGEKIVNLARLNGLRVIVIGREAARAFEFRHVGTSSRCSSAEAGDWYDVPTTGSLPPISIAWTEPGALADLLK